ncbi:hypothetical protein predicted by Glimmer/Critica [Lactiplantibacillus plantarum]|nr:hypothetical protein predicted by Glimmer/Critica [Lactiplantibacillus plantarum]
MSQLFRDGWYLNEDAEFGSMEIIKAQSFQM